MALSNGMPVRTERPFVGDDQIMFGAMGVNSCVTISSYFTPKHYEPAPISSFAKQHPLQALRSRVWRHYGAAIFLSPNHTHSSNPTPWVSSAFSSRRSSHPRP
jgi:hypothetical protein